MKNNIPIIVDVLCLVALIALEIFFRTFGIEFILSLGVLVLSVLIVALATSLNTPAKIILTIISLLIYPLAFSFFSAIDLPENILWRIITCLVILYFFVLMDHYYRYLEIIASKLHSILLLALLSIYIGLVFSFIPIFKTPFLYYFQHFNEISFSFSQYAFLGYSLIYFLGSILIRYFLTEFKR